MWPVRAPFPFAAGTTPSSHHLPATVYSRLCRYISDTHRGQRGEEEGKEEVQGREEGQMEGQKEGQEKGLEIITSESMRGVTK